MISPSGQVRDKAAHIRGGRGGCAFYPASPGVLGWPPLRLVSPDGREERSSGHRQRWEAVTLFPGMLVVYPMEVNFLPRRAAPLSNVALILSFLSKNSLPILSRKPPDASFPSPQGRGVPHILDGYRGWTRRETSFPSLALVPMLGASHAEPQFCHLEKGQMARTPEEPPAFLKTANSPPE